MRSSIVRLLLVAAVLSATQPARVEAAAKMTNVILIMADDVGYECFGCYGSKQYSTPNIDRMAKNGMLFTHCYSQPLCTPSRVKIMTGISNVRNYSAFSVLNSDQKTIGHYFKEAGYKTLVAGKWQLLGAEHYKEQFRLKGAWPDQTGFDQHCLWQVDKLGSRFWQPLLNIDGENRPFGKKTAYGPDVVNEYVLDFMEREKSEPFLIYYPMILVHNPFDPTPDSESLKSKNKQRNFEDMVAYMDKLIGKVIVKTQELGIAENTLIIFCGDNGTNVAINSTLNGVQIKGGKGKTTDAGTRVPMVALQPGTISKGRVYEELVDFSDFLPTCLDACGLEVPTGIDGRSFAPQLRGEPGQPREWVHCFYCPRPERSKPQQFVRDKRWKLYRNGTFFDVANDVKEKNDLSGSETSDAAAARAKLQTALDSFPAKGQQLLNFVPNDR
ncbi:MAG: sulfatase-like hydrolase/transferase [Planctomycetales bacterium]